VAYVAWLAPRRASGAATPAARPTSVAVLPFDVTALSPEQGHLSIALADALITRLGNAGGVEAQPTSAIARLRTTTLTDPVAAGHQLGADVVVEGRVRPEGPGVSVTLQAVRVRDRALVWAGEFHDSSTTVAQSAGSMAAQLVHAIGGGQAPRVESAPTRNPEAYEAYLRGRHLWNRRDDASLTAAIGLYRRALELDPGFALAHVGIANVHAFRSTPDEAERNLAEALKIDPTVPEAQATLGFLRMFHYWDWKGAEQAFRRALSANPSDATAHHWYGLYLMLNRRFDEAIASLEQAKRLEPVSAAILSDLGLVHHAAGDDARAVELCTQALQLEPGMIFARHCLTQIYEQQGNYRLAVETEFGRSPQLLDVLDRRGYPGIVELALRDQLKHQAPGWCYQAAQRYALLGQDDLALKHLDQSVSQHEFLVPYANVSKRFDRLRGTLAFQEAMRRIGLNTTGASTARTSGP
jgi:tetratricopeptide (TPR) repeat protein